LTPSCGSELMRAIEAPELVAKGTGGIGEIASAETDAECA